MQLLCDRFFLGQRRAIITQKGNTQQKKIMSAPRSKLVNQWAFTGLSNKNMDQGLLPQTRNDSEAAASLNSSPQYDEDSQKLQIWSSLPSFQPAWQSKSLSSLQFFWSNSTQIIYLFTHFYAAKEGCSRIFHVSSQTCDLLLTPRLMNLLLPTAQNVSTQGNLEYSITINFHGLCPLSSSDRIL